MADSTQGAAETNDIELMARYEITRVPAEQFFYKSYRYSNLADALAQAKRDHAPS